MDRFSSEFSVDTHKDSSHIVMDFRPTTILEELQDNTLRTLKPVGQADANPTGEMSTGGRGLTDTEAAIRLGAQVRK